MTEGDSLQPEREVFNVDHDDFDLLHAAALLIRVEGGSVGMDKVRAEIDTLAAEVLAEGAGPLDWPHQLVALGRVIFARHGFSGDADSYDDPANSFVQKVLERRRGLPITLSLIFCEVARRVGLDAYGIAFPGHFLVAIGGEVDRGGRELVVVDPFHRGKLWGPEHLQEHLDKLSGGQRRLSGDDLRPATPSAILFRMLNNLRGSYARRQDPICLEATLSRMLLVKPNAADLLLERAQTRHLLSDAPGAERDLERILKGVGNRDQRDRARTLQSRWQRHRSIVH
jgi:regulator of sirC expression with transglutaminase-like and TPR domain